MMTGSLIDSEMVKEHLKGEIDTDRIEDLNQSNYYFYRSGCDCPYTTFPCTIRRMEEVGFTPVSGLIFLRPVTGLPQSGPVARHD